ISETDYAIYLNDVESTDFFHNTVLGDPGLGLNDVEIGVRVVNNIMASLTGYALDYSDADPLDSLDYNIYYTPVSNTNFVEVGTANFVDLADFQANLPGNYNTNSLEGNPIFISTSNDLHVLGPLADSSATPIGITVDVDGDTRNATFPDIGADEFDVRQIDIALLEILEQPQDDCDIAADSIVVRIAGFGIQPQSNVDVYYSVNGAAPVLGGTGTASVGIAEYDTVTLSGFDFTMDGIYDIEIFVSVANDEELSNDTINTTVENLSIPDLIVDNVSAICDSGTATIDVSTTAMMVNWYLENDTASAVYDTGRSVVTPFLTESDTLYAELIDEQSGFVGPLDNTIGTTNTSALTNQYMIFDVFQTLTLNSVLIIGDGTGGTITVTLEDNNSNVLQTASLNIVDGPNRYNLGFVIPPGTGYQLRVQNFGSASIYRNTTGANYPYELPGFLTITGNSFSPTYVYYFYDWEILVPGCNSDLIPVPVPVNPSPVVNLGADSEICQGDALVLDAGNAGADYEWSDGSDNQTLSVSTAGDYSVTVTDPSTCSDSDTVSVAVNPLPSVSIGNDTTLCDTAWVIFDAGAGFDAYRWTLNGDLVGNTQMITVEFPGTYTVEVETDQACTNTASATITVENCVGIEGLFAENAISIYPNPNDGQFNLSVDMEQATKALFTLVDLSGKVIYEEELTLNQGNTTRNYDFDLLSAGVYLVKLTTEKDHHVQRLVID
ncbi:MAG: T9SS type A sorting domain-containing protein, partial [Chitinophagales bacterium]